MKTFITILSSILFLHSAYAQTFTKAGTCEAGGGISFSSTTISPYTSTQNSFNPSPFAGITSENNNIFVFDPYFGVMVTGGFELGIMGTYSHNSVLGGYSDFAGYFAPAYNINTKSILFPYIEPFVGYATSTSALSTESARSGLGAGVEAGLKIIIGNHGLVIFQFQYVHQERTYDYHDEYFGYGNFTSGTVSYNTNSIFTGISFRLFFGGKTEISAGAEQQSK